MIRMTSASQLTKIQASLASLIHNNFYEVYVCIDNYPEKITKYFQKYISHNVRSLCMQTNISRVLGFQQFGLIIKFQQATTLQLHDEEMKLADSVKFLVEQYGAVFFQNVQLPNAIAPMGHKNNFAHLNFHSDRGEGHENKYSLYTRDPRDEDHQEPRTASTLFIDNAVAYLQGIKEGIVKSGEQGRRRKYEIFSQEDVKPLFGSIIFEQSWSAPSGMGEVGIINNDTVLHASYKHGFDPGYRIGARYLF